MLEGQRQNVPADFSSSLIPHKDHHNPMGPRADPDFFKGLFHLTLCVKSVLQQTAPGEQGK